MTLDVLRASRSLVSCPLSFHDCARGPISYVFPRIQSWCHPPEPSSYCSQTCCLEKEMPHVPASSNTGPDLGALTSPSHLCALGQVCMAPLLPPGPCKLSFCQDLARCHVSWPHGTGHSSHGHVWPRCVHMCPNVCMCSMRFILLGLVAPSPVPSMSWMSLPWLQSTISWERGSCPSESWQPPPVRVCFVEQNVNPSLDGLLDLFN